MKNPFRPDHSDQDRDNPLVPNAVERPMERAAERGERHDNPLVPNAIERPVERAMANEREVGRDVADRPAIGERGHFDDTGDTRRGIDDSHDALPHEHAVAGTRTFEQPRVDARQASRADVMDRQMDLFPQEELVGYRTQWESIQTGFVDQPRAAVEHADALVSQLVNRLTEVFTRERSMLEGQWTKGDNVSTEELRVALTRYRSFFHRLLSM